MPNKISSPCSQPGCPAIAVQGGRCAAHQRAQARRYDDQRGTPSERGYGYAWRQQRATFLQHYPYCMGCGALATDVDHIIPKARGGSDEVSNLQALCHACHARKTARHDGGWGNDKGLS